MPAPMSSIPGAPFGPRKVVGGTAGAGAMGYTIVAAETMWTPR